MARMAAPLPGLRPWRSNVGRRTVLASEDQSTLQFLVQSGGLSCEEVDQVRYGRNVARCAVKGADLGAAMVRVGRSISSDTSNGVYAREERDARLAKPLRCALAWIEFRGQRGLETGRNVYVSGAPESRSPGNTHGRAGTDPRAPAL
jgi:hypothetical protein